MDEVLQRAQNEGREVQDVAKEYGMELRASISIEENKGGGVINSKEEAEDNNDKR